MPAGSGLISMVTRHRVAPNLLMVIFILSGLYAFSGLKSRFFPPFEVNGVTVWASLSGLSASDSESSLLEPLENALRTVPDYDEIFGYAREGSAEVILEFPEGTDMKKAVDDIKAEVDRANLPSGATSGVVRHARDEDISKITLAGGNRSEIRKFARRLETDLNSLGIGTVSVSGLAEEEIRVLVDQEKLVETGLSLNQIGLAVRATNRKATIGSLAGSSERSLRVDYETSDFDDLYRIPIGTSAEGFVTYLRDVAVIERVNSDNQLEITYQGKPAVEFAVAGGADVDVLAEAEKLTAWLARTQAKLPAEFVLVAHDEEWRAIKSRRDLLIKNGASGLVLVLLILFLMLSGRVAFWVAAGIPVAMLATIFVFEQLGGTLNMISMFALIMAVGIIVDDAIVVGENAQHRLKRGEPPMRAVIGAARTMFVPVFASSFTTIAAFMPLFLITGPLGGIIFDIPLIIICILLAALLECFLILPGHLYYSFTSGAQAKAGRLRTMLDNGFHGFRERIFRPIATIAVRHNLATIAAGFMMMALAIGLLQNGLVDFRFFPGAERSKLTASVEFVSGTDRAEMEEFTNHLLAVLPEVEADFGYEPGTLVQHSFANYGRGRGRWSRNSDQNGRVDVELVGPDKRDLTGAEFSRAWRKKVSTPPEVAHLNMRAQRGGPPGRDIEIRLTGQDVGALKIASLQIQDALAQIPGISEIADDTPYGKEEYIFSLTPLGKSLNLNVRNIADQLQNATDGFNVQTLTEGIDEIEIRVMLAPSDTDRLTALKLQLPNGEFVPHTDIISLVPRQGFDSILHQRGQAAVNVNADLDDDASISAETIIAGLEDGILKQLAEDGIEAGFEGRSADQEQTQKEMMTGLLLAVALIYIILTWVFNSWSMPVVVMVTMPMGVIGTIIGHWIMGISMSILSMFGMFTLMGIIVNDSIVLVRCFLELRDQTNDRERYEADIVQAACERLRAVLLTSLTTIGGLLPLLFETSLQAQFLIPMAVSITFGLAFATFLILLFTPACMALHGYIYRFRMRSKQSKARRHHLAQA